MEVQVSVNNELVQRSIEKFWETFPGVWHSTRAHVDRLAAERYDLTMAQFAVLRGVRKGRDSVSRLAQIGHISRPAISRTVDTLVNMGLVARQRDPDDRRHVRLALTGEGERLLEALHEAVHGWMRSKMEILEAAQLEQVIQGLDCLGAAFAATGDG